MKYQIKITYPDGLISYLGYRNKTSWCKRSAKKNMDEFSRASGLACVLEAA